MNNHDQVQYQKKIKELFEKANDLPENKRKKFLDELRKDNINAYREIMTLLKESESPDSPLDDLANQMIWPALKSLSKDATRADALFDTSDTDNLSEADSLIGKRISQFEIEAAIGKGGMGMVYRARDTALDRTVALKFLPPALSSDNTAKERFIQEAKAASALDHPNIATVHEIGETGDGQMFIAMGYYPGETLKDKLGRGPVPPEQALDYAIQLVSALDAVHRNGFIHRDIKPGNIIISNDGSLKLLDFGLAKLSYATGYTKVGEMMGTVAYMSPEQARGIDVDHRTDIWSVGILLYEMLSGERPFQGEDTLAAIHSILFENPKSPMDLQVEIPKSILAILGVCLKKDPEDRYNQAGDLLDDLYRAQEGYMPVKQGGMKTWIKSSRRQWYRYTSAAAMIVMGISLYYIAREKSYELLPVSDSVIARDKGRFIKGKWGDYDNDGYLDLILTDNTAGGFNQLYHNDGDGTFTRIMDGILPNDPIAPFASFWVDLDNDRDLDVFSIVDKKQNDAYYRNDGGGNFSKLTEGNWLNGSNSANSAAFADYDNDGDLDMFIANSGEPEFETNVLYRNDGGGRMAEVDCAATGPQTDTHGVLWSDFNNDGFVDLFVPGQEQVLFRNNKDGTFSWQSPEQFGIPEFSEDLDIGFSSADYDNDGDLDVLYRCWKVGTAGILYRNERGSGFNDVSYLLPCEGQVRIMGVSWGDYDNDGFIDLFVSNIAGYNLLFHNEGNGSFKRVTKSPVVKNGLQTGGAEWVDFDRDGDLDLFVANGMFSEYEQQCELYLNNGGKNNWIAIDLEGTVSNSFGIGAKVWVQANIRNRNVVQLRELQISCTEVYSSGPKTHFGLGNATIIESIRIDWPSGQVQELENVTVNQYLTITESLPESQ